MNLNFIAELNGDYWGEIIDDCFRTDVGLIDGGNFYDFVYMYCGA